MKQVICYEVDEASRLAFLKGSEYKHLVSVLRKKLGDHLSLRLASGELFDCEIIKIKKDVLVCKLLSKLDDLTQDSPLIVLLQWELKGSKMDTVVRQATEIGVSHIIPVFGEYSIPKIKNENEKLRREKIIRSAREQSGSPITTKLFSSTSINNALSIAEKITENRETLFLLAYEKKEECSKNVFSIVDGKEEAIVLCIGAEGGISEEEYSLLTNRGFKTIHFNTNILKAETATIYALSSVREAYYAKK
jgi:hypothetical protein